MWLVIRTLNCLSGADILHAGPGSLLTCCKIIQTGCICDSGANTPCITLVKCAELTYFLTIVLKYTDHVFHTLFDADT